MRCSTPLRTIAGRRSLRYGDGLGAVQRERSGSLSATRPARYAFGGVGSVQWAMWLGTLPSAECRSFGARLSPFVSENGSSENLGNLLHCGIKPPRCRSAPRGQDRRFWAALSVRARLSLLVGNDGPSDDFGYLRHYGVAEGVGSVHPAGNPIIVSNSEGCG